MSDINLAPIIPMELALWPVEKLVPYANNPRKNDHAVDRMVTVIKEFGFRIPLVVRSNGEIIDGHLRLKAALVMGLREVPVLLADDMSLEQVRAFRLMVNRSSTWATWNEELLAEEISKLLEVNYDLILTGFDQSELDKLLRELVATEKDPDVIPAVPEMPVIKEGELWLLGNHRLMCGDSLNSLHVGHLMGGKSASMIWTDPPYNVNYEGKAGKIKNDKMSATEFDDFLLKAMQQMYAVLIPGGGIYVAHSEAGKGMAFRQAFSRAGFRFASCLIWNKGQSVLSRGDYHWQHEPILYGWKPGAAHKWYGNHKQKTVINADIPGILQQEDGSWTLLIDGVLYKISGQDTLVEKLAGTVINIPKPTKSELHPTTKPVDLVLSGVSNSSKSGAIVFEPFSGSGTTLIACEKLGRACCAMENDPRFVQVNIIRWQDFTGKQAVRDVDGMPLDELLASQ